MLAFNHFLSIECDDPEDPVEAVIPYLLLTLFPLEIPFINNIRGKERIVLRMQLSAPVLCPCFQVYPVWRAASEVNISAEVCVVELSFL